MCSTYLIRYYHLCCNSGDPVTPAHGRRADQLHAGEWRSAAGATAAFTSSSGGEWDSPAAAVAGPPALETEMVSEPGTETLM